MNRLLKYSLLTISLTTILVTGAVIFFMFFLDLNSYKPLISQIVKKEMQRELDFEGDISFAAFPKIEARLRHFSISEYKSSKKFMTADSVYFTLPLRQLLDNQLVLNEISIKGLKAALIRFPDGRTNVDDLLTADGKKMGFVLGQARIENSRFVLLDAMNKKQFTLSGLTLESGKITNNHFSNLELKTKGSMKRLGNHTNYDFTVKLNVPDMQYHYDHISGNDIRLIANGTYAQHKIFAELALTNLFTSTHYFHSDAMAIKILAKKDTQIIRIHLSSPLHGELNTQKLHLPDLKAGFVISANHLSDQSTQGSLLGNISLAAMPTHISADFTGNIENSHLQATLNITGFDKPVVNFDAAIDHLNTDQFQFNNDQAELNNLIHNKSLNKKVDFPSLSALEVNGSVYIGTAQIADTAFSGVTFQIQSGKKNLNSASKHPDSAY